MANTRTRKPATTDNGSGDVLGFLGVEVTDEEVKKQGGFGRVETEYTKAVRSLLQQANQDRKQRATGLSAATHKEEHTNKKTGKVETVDVHSDEYTKFVSTLHRLSVELGVSVKTGTLKNGNLGFAVIDRRPPRAKRGSKSAS